jgi:hypothetical protein
MPEEFPVSKEIEQRFTYHRPFGTQPQRYEDLRTDAKLLAAKIDALCPASREKSLAMTHLQEAIMFANAAIAINEAQEFPDSM